MNENRVDFILCLYQPLDTLVTKNKRIVMRIEATDGNEHKVWLTDTEINELRRVARSQRDDIIIQLGAYVGLRASEIPHVRPCDIKESQGGQYRLRVRESKDNEGGGGRVRHAYLPSSVRRDLQRFQDSENIAPKETFIDLKQPGVRAVVKRLAERAAEDTDTEDFGKVSTHDLRRRFAQRLLVDESMNPRVVMDIGGWKSFQAIEQYLHTPTAEAIDEAFEDVDIT